MLFFFGFFDIFKYFETVSHERVYLLNGFFNLAQTFNQINISDSEENLIHFED